MTWDSLQFVFVLSWDSHFEILLTKMCNLGGGNSKISLFSPLKLGIPCTGGPEFLGSIGETHEVDIFRWGRTWAGF